MPSGVERLLTNASSSFEWPTAVFRTDDGWLVGHAAELRKLDRPAAYSDRFKGMMGTGEPLTVDGKPYRPEELAAEVLRCLVDTAARTYGITPRRLLITVPHTADKAWHDATIRAGQSAGFRDVELLSEPEAAAYGVYAARTARDPYAAPWPKGARILVYDLGGGTFDVALLRVGDSGPEVVDHSGLDSGSGADRVDLAVAAGLKAHLDAWFVEHSHVPREDPYLTAAVKEHARKLKHQLTDTPVAETRIYPAPLYSISRDDLKKAADPLLAETMECCRALLAKHDLDVTDVDAVFMVGGGSKMPAVAPTLRHVFGVEPQVAGDPAQAVVVGAAQWCRDAARWVDAPGPSAGVVPLRWTAPQPQAVSCLTRWLVEPDECFRAGDVLAMIRLAGGSLREYKASSRGRILRRHLDEGQDLFDGDWILTTLAPAGAEDLCEWSGPMWRIQAPVTASAISPNGTRVVLAVAAGPSHARLLIVDAHSGAVVEEAEFSGRVQAVAWAPDGRTVAFGVMAEAGPEIRLLMESGETQSFAKVAGAVNALAFAANGAVVLAGSGKGELHRIETGSRAMTTETLMRSIESLAVHPSGAFFVAAGADGRMAGRLCVVPLDRRPRPAPFSYPGPIGRVRFGRDGSELMVASEDVLEFFGFKTDLTRVDVRSGTPTGWVRAVSGGIGAWQTPDRAVRVAGEEGSGVWR
ncbi:Hsp70 family protein [Catenulispora yoronensis]